MCTIITTDKIDNILFERIRADASANPHGLACVTYDGSSYQIIKTLDAESLIHSLKFKKFQRVWVHTRNATTWARGINATHAFIEGDFIIFHNGVLNSARANAFPVDSMLLCELLKLGGPYKMQAMLDALGEQWANIMVINTKIDKYYVLRQQTGQLHTDGKGNYSTHPFAEITKEVSQNSRCEISLRPDPIVAPMPNISVAWENFYQVETVGECLSLDEIRDLKAILPRSHGDDFYDLVFDYGFNDGAFKRSQDFFELCSKSQKKNLKKIWEDHDEYLKKNEQRFQTALGGM